MPTTDTSEKNMNNTVLSKEMEEKLGALAARAEDHVRYGTHDTREALRRLTDDPMIANWVDVLRKAGRAPSHVFPSRQENGSYR